MKSRTLNPNGGNDAESASSVAFCLSILPCGAILDLHIEPQSSSFLDLVQNSRSDYVGVARDLRYKNFPARA